MARALTETERTLFVIFELTGHLDFASGDSSEDEPANFDAMMARIQTPGEPQERTRPANSPEGLDEVDLRTPARELGFGQGVGDMPETSSRQFSQMAEMMAKIQNLEKDRDALLERNDIVGVLTKGQDQMHLLLSERSKRERTEKGGCLGQDGGLQV